MASHDQQKPPVKNEQGLKSTKSGDFSDWYTEVVQRGGLADYSPVAGCMIILPNGYSIWESIQQWFDKRIKARGVRNVYFPLFIPESLLKKEADHFTGFVPEAAFVQEETDGSGVKEKFALRPTSETIICDHFAKTIRSWRDLPTRFNQWCNIVRWEIKATKLFLRTREFLWQEGHTLHETQEEAEQEVADMLAMYKELSETVLAIPVIAGKKSEKEKFAGAVYSTTIEGLMPSGRALQMGTSHYLGTNFAEGFDISFLDRKEQKALPHQTSWGISTRLIGAVAMAHGDEKGLVLPPAIAPLQVVIVPILYEDSGVKVLALAQKVRDRLKGKFRVYLDDRDNYSPGWKYNQWELEGVPLRLEIGPKDVEKNQVVSVRRDTREKAFLALDGNIEHDIEKLLAHIQSALFQRAKAWQDEHTVHAKSLPEIKAAVEKQCWAKVPWCGSVDCETKLDELSASIRVIPDNWTQASPASSGSPAAVKCAMCGKPAKHVAVVGKAY